MTGKQNPLEWNILVDLFTYFNPKNHTCLSFGG